MSAILEENTEVGEVVYSPDMPDKPPTVAVLNERVTNHIRFFWAIVAVAFTCIGILFFQLHGVGVDIASIKGSLHISAVSDIINGTTTADGQNTLPSLQQARKAISTASKESLAIDPAIVLKAARTAIQAATNTGNAPLQDEAWGTVQEAVNYVSARNSPGIPKELSICKLGALIVKVDAATDFLTVVGQQASFSDCILDLDYVPNQAVIVLEGPATCERCIVKYSGGRSAVAGTIIFKDCRFILKFDTPPSIPGRQFAETLVLSGLKSAEIPKS